MSIVYFCATAVHKHLTNVIAPLTLNDQLSSTILWNHQSDCVPEVSVKDTYTVFHAW